MTRLFSVLLMTITLSLSLSCQTSQEGTITKVTKTDLQKNVIGKDVQLVDVRTFEEYEAGHIDDAVNFNIIDSETFVSQISNLNQEEPVYLYCKMGGRSSRAAELLKEKGFKKIYDYSGGYNDWVSE